MEMREKLSEGWLFTDFKESSDSTHMILDVVRITRQHWDHLLK